MKLSHYAKKMGVTYHTAWNWFKAGEIPDAYQMPTGTIIVPENNAEIEKTVTYAQVSSAQNKDNLNTQSERLRNYCAANGWTISKEILEVGSGLNDSRPKLLRLLSDEEITRIVVEHKDRLTRFGFRYLDVLLTKRGCQLVVINECEDDRDNSF